VETGAICGVPNCGGTSASISRSRSITSWRANHTSTASSKITVTVETPSRVTDRISAR
jgi:hypothetical protein